jgi:hypothetical protein
MSETYDPLLPFTDEHIWGTPITDFVSSKRANWVSPRPRNHRFLQTRSLQSINADVVATFMTIFGMGRYNGRRNKNGESILDLLRCKVHSKLLKMLPRALGRSSNTGSTTSGSAHRGSSTLARTLDQGIRNGPNTSSTLSTRNVIGIDSIPSFHSVPSSHNPPSIDSVPSTLTEPTSSWDSNSSASSVSSTPSEPSNTRKPRNLPPAS